MVLFAFSCQSGSESTLHRGPDKVRQEVDSVLHAYFDATRHDGLLAGLPFLDNSEQFFWVPPGYDSAIDYDSVVKVIRSHAPHVAMVNNSWRSLQINVLNDSAAVFTGEILSVTIDTSGRSTANNLLETGVMILRKDGWRMLCGQTRVNN